MIKLTEKYTDYNGVERTEDFYFHLTEAQLMEMELGVTGGLSEKIKKIINTKDHPTLIKLFKDLVLTSYGVKSDDGRRFIKNDALSTEFAQTEAYSQIFMRLATNDEEGAAFVNGIVPQKKEAPAQNHPALTK